MASSEGQALKRRREALGLSLEDVSTRTGIAVDYLDAVEREDPSGLPSGPYAQAYERTYRSLLDRAEARQPSDPSLPTPPPSLSTDPPYRTGTVPTPEGDDGPPTADPVVHSRPIPEPRESAGSLWLPLPYVRRLAMVSTGALVVLTMWRLVQPWTDPAPPTPSASTPLDVAVLMRRNGHLTVRLDGRVVEDRLFQGAEEARWTAHDRIEIEVPAVDAVNVWFDGRRIEPRGKRGRPRVLTFLASDTEGAP